MLGELLDQAEENLIKLKRRLCGAHAPCSPELARHCYPGYTPNFHTMVAFVRLRMPYISTYKITICISSSDVRDFSIHAESKVRQWGFPFSDNNLQHSIV